MHDDAALERRLYANGDYFMDIRCPGSARISSNRRGYERDLPIFYTTSIFGGFCFREILHLAEKRDSFFSAFFLFPQGVDLGLSANNDKKQAGNDENKEGGRKQGWKWQPLNFNPARGTQQRKNHLGVIFKLNSPSIVGNKSSRCSTNTGG